MICIDYHLKQVGKVLTCTDESNKIIINKYDNKVSRILFDFDSSIFGRLYFAMLNPITKRYFFTPIVDNAITITTKVSAYPGAWRCLLLAVENDYEIVNENIDQSKVTFVSDEFRKVVVRDNFLSEDEEDIEVVNSPEIDELLDRMVETLNTATRIIDDLDEETIQKVKAINELIKTDGSGKQYLADDGRYYTVVQTVNENKPDENGNADIQAEILQMLESAGIITPLHADEDTLFTDNEGCILIL